MVTNSNHAGPSVTLTVGPAQETKRRYPFKQDSQATKKAGFPPFLPRRWNSRLFQYTVTFFFLVDFVEVFFMLAF
jgi:hypothetical protein